MEKRQKPYAPLTSQARRPDVAFPSLEAPTSPALSDVGAFSFNSHAAGESPRSTASGPRQAVGSPDAAGPAETRAAADLPSHGAAVIGSQAPSREVRARLGAIFSSHDPEFGAAE